MPSHEATASDLRGTSASDRGATASPATAIIGHCERREPLYLPIVRALASLAAEPGTARRL